VSNDSEHDQEGPAEIPNVSDVFDPEFTVLLYEFKADIAAYLFEQGTRARHAPRFLKTLGVREFLPRDTVARKGGAGGVQAKQRARTEPSKASRSSPAYSSRSSATSATTASHSSSVV
jgi:hypothetical protein